MRSFSPDASSFARAVLALEPYLDDVVFVGGWAHHLYTLHPEAVPVAFEILRTQDADVAAPLGLPRRGSETIAARLLAEGFVQELRGDETPPVSEYRLGDERGGFYVEFLAPLEGGETGRRGKRNVTVRVGGVSAQTLRHLEILLIDPWQLILRDENGFPLGPRGKTIKIANPASYIVQKILALKYRSPKKQGKDLLYVHDTLMLFSAALPSIKESWRMVSGRMHPAHVTRFHDVADRLFDSVTDVSRNAARVASTRTRPPTPAEILAACRAGYRAVFAS